MAGLDHLGLKTELFFFPHREWSPKQKDGVGMGGYALQEKGNLSPR